jgi:hypothetical protein
MLVCVSLSRSLYILKKIQNLSKKTVRGIVHIKHKPFKKIIVRLHLQRVFYTLFVYISCQRDTCGCKFSGPIGMVKDILSKIIKIVVKIKI